MPYFRVFSPFIPQAQKRLIVRHLIEITSRAFQLRAEDRDGINIQFILLPGIGSVTGFGPAIPDDADFFLEVNHQGLSKGKKRAFAEEIKPVLRQVLAHKRGTWFTRQLGVRPGMSRQVALLFREVSPKEVASRPVIFPALERRAA